MDGSLPQSDVNARVARWLRPDIQALRAYHVPDASGMIKLDAMENPYHWPAYLRGEWAERLQQLHVNRYPDPQALSLKTRLREAFGIPERHAVMLGNGSDELIQLILMALNGADRCVMAPEPSFSMYRMIARFVGMDYVPTPLRPDDFSLDMAQTLKAIETHQPAVIFLAYPNNPTGNLFAEQDIIEILQAAPGLVVVDEAYTPFADASFLPRLEGFDHLIVMRTLSKLGLAGLRLGYMVGSHAWMGEFDKVRLPYNINMLTQASAELALMYPDIFQAQTRQICKDRAALKTALSQLKPIRVYPSAANFILFRVPPGCANAVFEGLKRDNVLVKNLDGADAMLRDCLRVTVGRPEENQAFLRSLSRVLTTVA